MQVCTRYLSVRFHALICSVLLLASFSVTLPTYAAEEDSAETDISKPSSAQTSMPVNAYGKVMVIPVEGVIVPDSATIRALVSAPTTIDEDVVAAIKKAEKDGARLIVLEIDSPGGVVDSCETINSALLATEIPTVALVTNQAISGGSMVATACKKIVMVKGTTIGDCEPHAINSELPDYMREKIETKIRADMRANAQANGYPDKLLEAMVTKNITLYKVKFEDGEEEFLRQSELEVKEEQIASGEIKRVIADRKIVVEGDKLLTLTAQEALEYGLASEIVSSAGAFYSDRKIPESEKVSPPKKIVENEELPLAMYMVLILCLVIGVAGAVVEANVPGFGMPGVVGLIGFSSFFVILLLNGRAEHWEIALFVVGLILLLIEIFIIPGFGVAGISGILCLGAAFTLAFLPDFDSTLWHDDWGGQLEKMLTMFGVAGLISIIVAWFLASYLDRIPLLRSVVLSRSLRAGGEVMDEAAVNEAGKYPHEEKNKHTESELKGLEGVAVTVLRPAGKIRTDDGRTFDVVAAEGMIPAETRVRIIEVNGPRIAVSPIA